MLLCRALAAACAALGRRSRAGPAAGPLRAALPDNVVVVPPDPDVPADLAAFSGVWTGAWDGDAAAGIAVERVSRDGSALVIHAHDPHPVLGTAAATVARARAGGGALRLRPGGEDGPEITLRLTAPGVMAAEGRRGGDVALGAFRRAPRAAERPRMARAVALGYGPAR